MIVKDKVKVGSKWSRQSYGEIVDTHPQGYKVRNELGHEWFVSTEILDYEFTFADQYDEEVTLTRTSMVEKILASTRIAMTVHFTKKPEFKKLHECVAAMLVSDVRPGPRQLAKILKEATEGEPRTMIGRHYGEFDDLGRLRFTDMEDGGGLRLVDPRTVLWCIISGKRYEVK